MQPIDLISQEDKDFWEAWMRNFAPPAANINAELALQEWNKSKRKLFKMFGNQLRFSVPIDISNNQTFFFHTLRAIYTPLYRERHNYLAHEVQHPFILEMFEVIKDNCSDFRTTLKYTNIDNFSRLIHYTNIRNGYVLVNCSFTKLDKEGNPSKPLVISKNAKIMKSVRKVLSYFVPDSKNEIYDLYEDWRNQISNLNTASKVKGELVFSIHPNDFITMSESISWSSCMSFSNDGLYSHTTLEMMNSNNVVICYLKSDKNVKTIPAKDGGKDIIVPNKIWRCLVIVEKDIILTNRQYPFENHDLAITVVETLRDKAKSFGWKYSYGPQEYLESHSFHRLEDNYEQNYFIDDVISAGYSKSIYFSTKNFYNDLLCNSDSVYYCCRNNRGKSSVFSMSGKLTCVACGKKLAAVFHKEDMLCPNCCAEEKEPVPTIRIEDLCFG